MSERAGASSLSGAVRELIAQLPRWESRMAAWPQVVSERVAVALKTAQDETEARQQSEARAWAQERAAWSAEMQSQLQRLTKLAERQARLIERQEIQDAPWLLNWSWDRWKGLLVNVSVTVVLTLFVTVIGATSYWRYGPPAQTRAELRDQISIYQDLWDVTTEAERQRIQARLEKQRTAE